MFRVTSSSPSLRRTVVVAAFTVGAAAAMLTATTTVDTQAVPIGPTHDALRAELVKTGLYLISGGGANSLLRLSANGMILVDGKAAGQYAAVMSQVRIISKMSDLPLRFLVLTDHLPDRAGNLAQFVDRGVRIVAQANAMRNLESQHLIPAATAAPGVTYDRTYTLRLGGIEATLLHYGSARTNGDTVVYFPNLKVVAVGDLFGALPDPDYSAGGSLVGWSAALSEILSLDFDTVVPAKGPIVTRKDLETFSVRLRTLVERASGLVAHGVPREQFLDRLKTDDLGWRLTFTGRQLESVYSELARSR